jgi:hypothetical protein
VVHHLDGKPSNDELSNLDMIAIGLHETLHSREWGRGAEDRDKVYTTNRRNRVIARMNRQGIYG